MCIGHLLYTRLFKCFHWVDHRNPVLLSYSCDFPSHRCRNCGTGQLNILPLVTEGAKDRQDWKQILFSGSYWWSLSRLSLSAGRPKISVPPLLCLLTLQFSVFLPRSGLAIPQNLLVVFFLHVCMCACMHMQACPCTYMSGLQIFHLALTFFERDKEMSVYLLCCTTLQSQ